jgi:hypothetical protein
MTTILAATHGVALIAYALACLALGAAVLRVLLPPQATSGGVHSLGRSSSAFILGQGVLTQALVLAGLVLDFTSTLVWAAVALSVMLGAVALRAELKPLVIAIGDARAGWRSETSYAWKATALFSGMLLVLWGCAALVYPPMGDGEAFYFVYGKFIAAGGKLAPLTGNYEPFSTIGLLGEVHFAALMSIAGASAAKLFVWLIACAACMALWEIGRTCGLGPRGRLVTVVLTLTSSTFVLYIPDGKVDLFAAALGLGAYYWALQPANSLAPLAASRLSGLFAGLACVAKFSYIPVLAPGLLLLFLLKRSDPGIRSRLLPLANLALFAGLALLPHLTKNTVFFGEPLAPFVTASSERAWLNQVWFGPEATAWIVKTYPLALVFGQYPMQGGTLSFAWLALLPLAFLLPRSCYSLGGPLGQATAAGLLGLVLWVSFRPSVIAPRYILAPLLLLFLPVGKVAETPFGSHTRLLEHAALACLLVACLTNVLSEGRALRDGIAFARGRLPPCYRASIYCAELARVNDVARPGERAFLLLYHSYWLRPDLLLCRNTHAEGLAVKAATSAEDAWSKLAAAGLSLLVVDRTSHAADFKRLWNERPDWIAASELYRGTHVIAYRIASRQSDQATRSCEPGADGGWELREAVAAKGT